jgi:DNA-binding CsgD family transcriptional regulator
LLVGLEMKSQVVYHKDAEILARTSHLPFAAIGSISAHPQGVIKMRLGIGLPLGRLPARVPTGEIVRLLQGLIATSNAADPKCIDFELKLDVVARGQQVTAWARSERCLVVLQYPLAGITPFVALVGPAANSPFPRWQRELARLALMQESDRVHEEGFPSEAPDSSLLRSVLDQLIFPITVVEQSSRVAYCNNAALNYLRTSSTLSLSDGRLIAKASLMDERLRAALRAATHNVRPQSRILLPLDEQDTDRLPQEAVVVTPLPTSNGLALVVCANSKQNTSMVSHLLSELGLSPTEQRLAHRLVCGDCLDAAAEQINIKISTARSYLRSIFDKTGASQQSQLVALALSLAPLTSLNEPSAPGIGMRA